MGRKGIKLTKKKVLISIAVFLLIMLGLGAGGYLYVRNKIFANSTGSIGEISGDVNYEEVSGITNILLIGVDARDLNERARSDSMMIATIDNNTKKIKLTSIMRDSYVDITGYKTQKINAAYALGGPELLMDTIQRNFKIKLDKYVVINFWGFEDVIDLLGGIDVEIEDYEISEINKYIGEVRETKSPALTTAGMQHLDGQQALAFARIRKVGNGAYERDSRQREVVQILAEKLKETNVLQYANLMSKILPYIKTNIEPINFLNYAYTVSKFKPLTVQGFQMPTNELSSGQMYLDSWVLLMDKEQNSKVLNDFIFKDKVTDPKELDMTAFKANINSYLQKDKSLKPATTQEAVNEKEDTVDKTPVKEASKSTKEAEEQTSTTSTTKDTGSSVSSETKPETGVITTPTTVENSTPAGTDSGAQTPSIPAAGETNTSGTSGTTAPVSGDTKTPVSEESTAITDGKDVVKP